MLRLLTVWLWMCSLLVSTAGVSVARIYCYCKGEEAIALSLPLAPPNESESEGCNSLSHAEAAGCFQLPDDTAPTEEANCCVRVAEAGACCAEAEGKGALCSAAHTCKSKTVKIYQLKLNLYSPLSWDKLPDLPLWVGEAPFLYKCFCPVLCWSTPQNKAPPEPPPPLSGRQICIRHEVFRC